MQRTQNIFMKEKHFLSYLWIFFFLFLSDQSRATQTCHCKPKVTFLLSIMSVNFFFETGTSMSEVTQNTRFTSILEGLSHLK